MAPIDPIANFNPFTSAVQNYQPIAPATQVGGQRTNGIDKETSFGSSSSNSNLFAGNTVGTNNISTDDTVFIAPSLGKNPAVGGANLHLIG